MKTTVGSLLATQQGKPMQALLDQAMELSQRDIFLDEVNAAYARLRSDPKAWEAEQAERALWDRALAGRLAAGRAAKAAKIRR
jgi:hypothetical protein